MKTWALWLAVGLLAAGLPLPGYGQGYSASPPGVSSGRTLAQFPFGGNGALIDEDANTVSHVIFNPGVTNYSQQSNSASTGSSAVSPWAVFGSPTVSTPADTDLPGGGTWTSVTSTAGNSLFYNQQSLGASYGLYTASAYIKKGTGNGVASLMVFLTSPATCSCGRSDGGACTAYISTNYCVAQVTVGDAPVRVWATVTGPASATFQIAYHGGVYSGANDTAYFGGGQVEANVVKPSDLVVTTTAAVTVRPVDTNYVLQSAAVGSAPWSALAGGAGGTPGVVANAGTAPDGTVTADRITFANTGRTVNDYSIVRQSVALATGGTYSIYIKSNTGSNQPLQIYLNRDTGGVLAELVLTATTEWQRFTVTGSGSSGGNFYPTIGLFGANAPADAADVLVWGAQLEARANAAASAYIPTAGTAVTMDRALTDTKGNLWAMAGTVPQVQAQPSPFYPGKAGAGAFSTANYYSLGTGSDVLDFAGDFTACFVFNPTTADCPLFSDGGAAAAAGWGVLFNAGQVRFQKPAATMAISAAGAVVAGAANVACVGKSGTTVYSKANLTATGSATDSFTASAVETAQIGRQSVSGSACPGNIYEAWFSTTPFSEATVTAIQQKVLGHYDGSSPISVTRTTVATNIPRLSDCATGQTCLYTAAAGTARIAEDGLLVEPARTNYAQQSNTISTGSAATAPWALSNATVTTPAGSTPFTGTWAEVTSTTAAGYLADLSMTTASATTIVGSAWAAKASGSGYAAVTVDCVAGTTSTACTCVRSDGGSCTPSQGGTQCTALVSDLGTTPVRISAMQTCSVAGTTYHLVLYPGNKGVAVGTTRFTGAQLEVGTYPTSLIVTAGTSVARNGDMITTTVPVQKPRFCWATTAKPEEGRAWITGDVQVMLSNLGGTGYANFFTSAVAHSWQVNDGVNGTVWTSATPFAAGSHRFIACGNGSTQPPLTIDGAVTLPANGWVGSGTGIIPAPGTLLYIGNQSGSLQFGGFLKNIRLCNAKSYKECR